jgi:hypothetical protein
MTAAQVFIPKTQWGPGPWIDEPDQLLFSHAGLACYIYRNLHVTGSLCGYVALSPQHPWWGKDYNECTQTPPCDPDAPVDLRRMSEHFPELPAISERMAAHMAEPRWSCDHRPEMILDVHGGVTYAGPMQQVGYGNTPQSFEWGFGFDTGHAGDHCPLMDATLRMIYLAQGAKGKREWEEHQRIMLTGPMRNRYRTIRYVRAHVKRLADQLAAVRS